MRFRQSFFYCTVASVSLLTGTLVMAQPSDEPPPPIPPPLNTDGRVLLGGATPDDKGIWTPGGFGFGPAVPLEEIPFQSWSRALYDARQVHELEPHARCKASGSVRQFLTPYGVEFVELEALGRIYIFDIGGPHTFRTVYMDGRSHPADPEPSNYGHSIGWWEGDTLVIDSIGFNEDFWWERRGIPHTDQFHIIEKFTRNDLNAMEYSFMIDDPGAYTDTFGATYSFQWNEGEELFEYICQQANYADELMVGQESDEVDRSSPIIP